MPDNWDQLLEQVRQALTSTSDQELQGVMLRFYHEHSEVERPSHTEVIRLGARLLHFATGRLNARAAIMFMARASWEYTGAVKLYLETADDSDVEVEVDTARKYETSDVIYPLLLLPCVQIANVKNQKRADRSLRKGRKGRKGPNQEISPKR